MVKTLVKLMLPMSIVEKVPWKEYILLLDPSYSMPTTKTINNRWLNELNVTVLSRIKAKVAEFDWVYVSVDGWPDATMRGFNGYIAQGIDKDWEIHSIPIAFEYVSGRHTGEAIKAKFDVISKAFNIVDKTFKIVADQGIYQLKLKTKN